MYSVFGFRTDHCVIQNVKLCNKFVKWLCAFCIYFVCINEFLKIYLVTSFPGVAGSRSGGGCTLSKTQEYEGLTTCTCDHLTNFALLLDVSQTRHISRALSVVTWIGCGISIVGLTLTIVTYLYLKYVFFCLHVLKQCS